MYPYLHIFGREIPTYGITGMTAILLGWLLVIIKSRRLKLDRNDSIFLYMYGVIGALVGAKVFYLIQVLPDLIRDFHLLFSDAKLFYDLYILGGLVFYGGLIGAALMILIYCRHYHVNPLPIFPAIIPVLPFIHALGRIGCFLAGCCFGIPTNSPLGIAFSHSVSAPNHIPLLPVQLFESAGNMLLFLFLWFYANKCQQPLRLASIYLTVYSVFRFLLEYIRYDAARGFLWIFSTSQWISMVLFIIGITTLLWTFRKPKTQQ